MGHTYQKWIIFVHSPWRQSNAKMVAAHNRSMTGLLYHLISPLFTIRSWTRVDYPGLQTATATLWSSRRWLQDLSIVSDLCSRIAVDCVYHSYWTHHTRCSWVTSRQQNSPVAYRWWNRSHEPDTTNSPSLVVQPGVATVTPVWVSFLLVWVQFTKCVHESLRE